MKRPLSTYVLEPVSDELAARLNAVCSKIALVCVVAIVVMALLSEMI